MSGSDYWRTASAHQAFIGATAAPILPSSTTTTTSSALKSTSTSASASSNMFAWTPSSHSQQYHMQKPLFTGRSVSAPELSSSQVNVNDTVEELLEDMNDVLQPFGFPVEESIEFKGLDGSFWFPMDGSGGGGVSAAAAEGHHYGGFGPMDVMQPGDISPMFEDASQRFTEMLNTPLPPLPPTFSWIQSMQQTSSSASSALPAPVISQSYQQQQGQHLLPTTTFSQQPSNLLSPSLQQRHPSSSPHQSPVSSVLSPNSIYSNSLFAAMFEPAPSVASGSQREGVSPSMSPLPSIASPFMQAQEVGGSPLQGVFVASQQQQLQQQGFFGGMETSAFAGQGQGQGGMTMAPPLPSSNGETLAVPPTLPSSTPSQPPTFTPSTLNVSITAASPSAATTISAKKSPHIRPSISPSIRPASRTIKKKPVASSSAAAHRPHASASALPLPPLLKSGSTSSISTNAASGRRQRRTTKEVRSACVQCGRDFAVVLLHGNARDLALEELELGASAEGVAKGSVGFEPWYVCNNCCYRNGDPTSAGEGVVVPASAVENPYPNPKLVPKDAVVPVADEKPVTMPPSPGGASNGSNKGHAPVLSDVPSFVANRKRGYKERNESGEECEVACSACNRVLGRGGVRIGYRALSQSPPPAGGGAASAEEEAGGLGPFGRVSDAKRWNLPASIMSEPVCPSCVVKYAFCTACGAGGQYRIGKWRPKEMFLEGRKCCNLSHVRVQNAGKEGLGVERVAGARVGSALYFETKCVEDDEGGGVGEGGGGGDADGVKREDVKSEEGSGEEMSAARQRHLASLDALIASIKQERLDSLLTDVAIPSVMERAKGYGKSYGSIVEFQLKSTTLWEFLSAPARVGFRRYVRVLYYDHAVAEKKGVGFGAAVGGGNGGGVEVKEGKRTIVAYVVAEWDVERRMVLLETMYDRRATRTGRQYECRISSDTLSGLLDVIQKDCDRLNALPANSKTSNAADPSNSSSSSSSPYPYPHHVWLWALRHRHDSIGQALNGKPSNNKDETATDATDFSLRRLGFRPLDEHVELCRTGHGGKVAAVPALREWFVERECHFVRGYEKRVFMVYAADVRSVGGGGVLMNR
ncbi:hypothetical protein HDU97_007619 [Phlyctochytrium planicorne]|nr:hypothetical protein HDU97_007619 [Phlyctochytrium planicorne]